ncbi:MAG: Gfo/Idh/MocA family oxidoreductase [Verrucomicrobia bacterium]|nr:Gfo/Idh/MocA family oxidoreductase [Verrucomicrobiota bacterium]
MINVALIGMGRIGRIHATNLSNEPRASLRMICDIQASSENIAEQYGAAFSASPESVIQDPAIDAVFICTPAHTHIDLAKLAVQNGKYVFCEKPIDEDLEKARRFVETDPASAAKVMIGFHRRYDEAHRKLRQAVESGARGGIEQIIINSRDPQIGSYAVLANTGGIFRDMMMHDIDQAALLLPEKIVGVFARGTCLVDPIFAKNGDFDNAVATFWTNSGVTCTIINSRRSLFGFQQVIEIYCSGGTVSIGTQAEATVSTRDGAGEHLSKPPGHFLERYQSAYQVECQTFIESIESGKAFPVTALDGLRALKLADAADRSARFGQPVTIKD